MSQIVVDEQLGFEIVIEPLRKWSKAEWLPHLFHGEHIDDDRIPALLRKLRQPTFVTIDEDFWKPQLRDSRYCIVYVAVRIGQQGFVPGLVRWLFGLPEFSTRAKRMGKVIRLGTSNVQFFESGKEAINVLPATPPKQRRR